MKLRTREYIEQTIQALNIINEARVEAGLKPVMLDPYTDYAARWLHAHPERSLILPADYRVPVHQNPPLSREDKAELRADRQERRVHAKHIASQG
jgi:hypothetical protein